MTTDPTTDTARYRSRSVEIEAVQWAGDNADAMTALCSPFDFQPIDPEDRIEDPDQTAAVRTHPHGGWVGLKPGDWAVKRGDVYSVLTAEEFAERYEPAGTAWVDPIAKAVAALQKRAGELSALAEEEMRPSLEERAQEWLEAAAIVQRIGRKGA